MSDVPSPRGFTTAILHGDRGAAIEHGALHKPLHLSVAYGFEDARDLAAVFQGRQSGFVYGRQGNPTSAALEAKVNAMEEGVATVCFSTGMAAIAAVCSALLKAGDHVIASHYPVREHEQPVPDAGVARDAGNVRRRHGCRGRRARAYAPRRGWCSSRRSRTRARRSPTSNGSASSARRATCFTSWTTR